MTDKEQLYYELYERYVMNTFAPIAIKFSERYLSDEFPPNLTYILQSHEEGKIRDTETHIRDAFDCLLSFYSVIELACLSDCIVIPNEEKQKMFRILSIKPIKKFYNKYYTLVLPALLLNRLSTNEDSMIIKVKGAKRMFARFLDIDLTTLNNYYMDTFLWALDGGELKEHRLRDLKKLLESPLESLKSLAKPEEKMSGRDEMFVGFKDFLLFCKTFYEFLIDMNSTELQSVYWHYYAYWFKHLKNKMSSFLYEALNIIKLWEASGENSEIEDMTNIINYLINNKFYNKSKLIGMFSKSRNKIIFRPFEDSNSFDEGLKKLNDKGLETH